MLVIKVGEQEHYDDEKNEFIYSKGVTIAFEHSLVSLSKWESKWKKPFLNNKGLTTEETLDYIRCMTITQNIQKEVYENMNNSDIEKINDYIEDSMTATTFVDDNQKKTKGEVITAELIYYWLIAFTIPFECQKWHLNRLLTLINVCNLKNQPAKKMSRTELMNKNRALNEARRAKYNTKG